MKGLNMNSKNVKTEAMKTGYLDAENTMTAGGSSGGMGQADLRQARFAARALVLYRTLEKNDSLIRNLFLLLEEMDAERPDIFSIIDLYSSVGHGLINAGTGLIGYFIDRILHTENPFARTAEAEGAECLTNTMEAAVRHDLARLQILASIRPEWIREVISSLCKDDVVIREAVMELPLWKEDTEAVDGNGENAKEIERQLLSGRSWPECARELAEFHRQCGSGIFSKYRAFVWRNGDFVGVGSPDPVRFSDLISYELERKDIIENTLNFLHGGPANNILLYGDRGTGKSTTVKALINEYHASGLRMIEVPKKLLVDFPLIVRRLVGRTLKFILFIDDLAFEDNEENYTAMKAALEGGLESKPENVLIYATSNRKHLIKERFSDRAGLVSGNTDDEVRAADTMQEKLSLSDRFGMTVVFSSPDKKKYLEIVEGIAVNRGLEVDTEYLQREALKWELQYNGRSPRTAKQFVDWLSGTLSGRPS